jgi:hypothetical protein
MSEQGLSPENSPVVAGPGVDTGTAEQNSQPEVDWQKRYVDTQEAYTRGQQEIADLRRQQELYDLLLSTDDPDTRRQAALELGYQLEEEEEPEPQEYEDPFVRYDERLDRLEQSQSQRLQQEQDAEHAREVRAYLDDYLGQQGYDTDTGNLLISYALNALPVTEQGLPDIEGAHQWFQGWENERQKAWAQTKRAPHISPIGQQATEVPNLDNDQERQDYMTRRILSNMEP